MKIQSRCFLIEISVVAISKQFSFIKEFLRWHCCSLKKELITTEWLKHHISIYLEACNSFEGKHLHEKTRITENTFTTCQVSAEILHKRKIMPVWCSINAISYARIHGTLALRYNSANTLILYYEASFSVCISIENCRS